MRLFLGVEVPEEIKKQIFDALLPLRLHHPDFRWVQPKNYHLTVQFFGEVNNPDEISKRLKDILYDAQSFYLTAFHLDTMVGKNILLYLDFYRQKKLEEIVTTIRTDLGIEDKQEFLPHISLSKSALSSKQQYFALEREIEMLKIKLEFNVEKLTLFESITGGKQVHYNPIKQFKLL